ncbi:MAG TPA: efflux RND transporter periplasmic adaptor subunit [Terriglobales bacterium]|nr:efflux RND transporter periplasmic adaptor subunit [Terriglobales bacterium]
MKVEPENAVEERAVVMEPSVPGAEQNHPVRRWWIAVLAVVAAALLFLSGILPRVKARSTLTRETKELAVPAVLVVQPKRSAPTQEIVLPANVQAYVDSPIYARTNGYLKRWYVDIGARVKQGQLLAEIDTPEVDQQFRQAKADLATAVANRDLSKITADRYQGLLKTDSVSKQDADNAAGDLAAKQATVQSEEANLKRLQELVSFQKIYAPFEGVITARNTDIGALIDSGSSGGPRTELFHMVQPDKLRVYASVPQAYSQAAKPGMSADLVLSEFPGKRFQGTLVRTANAIDPSSRTLLVEISVNNPTGTLFAGAYAEVHLKLPTATSAFLIPANTLLFRSEGLRVGIAGAQGRVELRPITLGHDFGTDVEVVAGLTGNENVILNPPDSLIDGQTVRIVQPSANTQEAQ